MSQEKKPAPKNISEQEVVDAMEDMMLDSIESRPTGQQVSLHSIILDESMHEEGRLLTGALRLLEKGRVYQEETGDASKLYGDLDSKGNLIFTIRYKDTDEEDHVVIPKDTWHYKN